MRPRIHVPPGHLVFIPSHLALCLSTALVDRYQIEHHIGEGGMATVYLAAGGRTVCIS